MRDPNEPLKSEGARDRSCRSVRTAVDTHGQDLLRKLEPRLGGAGPEGGPSPLEQVLTGLVDWVEENLESLLGLGRGYRSAKAVQSEGDREIRKAERHCRNALAGIRGTISRTYGGDVAEELGFVQVQPGPREELLEHSTDVQTRFAVPDVSLPDPLPGCVPLDLAAQSSAFNEVVVGLRSALDGLHLRRRTTEVARVLRDGADEEYVHTFVWGLTALRALFTLGHMPRASKYLRPSTLRRGVTTVVTGEDPDPAAEPAGDGSSPEDSPPDSPPEGSPPEDGEPEGEPEADGEADPSESSDAEGGHGS